MIELGAGIKDEYWDMGDGEYYVTLPHNYPRHCPILVQSVEELGDEASGSAASLVVHTIKGDRYFIDEYDGRECIVEPDAICWIVVQSTEKQCII